ncbi:hypothetical protein G5I_12467, partial [Acromyrmex echinatior]
KMEKTKKVDKLPLDPQREFLDMDTDDEDFGRQESPETEEEQSSEPIKPVFDKQDLDKLVILPSLFIDTVSYTYLYVYHFSIFI